MDDQVSVVCGLQSKTAVTHGAVVPFFFMHVHYVSQVVTTLGECHLMKDDEKRGRMFIICKEMIFLGI